MSNPSRAVALYGTTEVVAPPRILRAGKLSVELEQGNLRYIRWDGAEMLRAASFIVRDRDWGTYAPVLSDLTVTEDDDAFLVTYHATAGSNDALFAYEARIEGRADGTLFFHGHGGSSTGFETNRTGFVILHPIAGIAGAPVTITHTDGRVVQDRFPEIIDPVQPMMNLRALTHVTPDGLKVHVLMEGDTYEMEDQRNWTDASYKTYVRPLARPWPYAIAPGEVVDQTITVTISGTGTPPTAASAVHLTPGAMAGAVPRIGIGLRPEDVAGAQIAIDALTAMNTSHIILHHDPRAGHNARSLAAMLDVTKTIGATPWLEAVIANVEDDAAHREIATLGQIAANLGDPFRTVLVSPAPDLKCTLPGSVWPQVPDALALYARSRAAFPKARIGGGMFSYFTELNRKRPPTEALDLVTFTTSPMVHAGDDRSVMETREAHAAVAASVVAIAQGTPWAVGPSAIGIRDNPYGAAAKDNPTNIRQAMNRNDPRHRGLLGAAWALGYIADFATGGASAVAIGGATGPFGIVSAPGDDTDPWYDGQGGLYPTFHVLRGLGRLTGSPMLALNLPASGPIAGIAAQTAAGIEIWVANTGPDRQEVQLSGPAQTALLDAEHFADATQTPHYLDHLADQNGILSLDSFAVARILLKG
jgi:hypothetical protein